MIISYLQGADRARICEEILDHANRDELLIVVSMLTHAEVAKPNGTDRDEATIREFFSRRYVLSIAVDRRVTAEARRLVQTGFIRKPADAIQAATALVYKIPVLETYNLEDFQRVRGHGDPALEVREPTWTGQGSLFTAG